MKKEILVLAIFLIPTILAEDVRVYNLNMEIFKNNTVEINQIRVIAGKVSDFPALYTGYKIKILSPSKILWEANLPVRFYINLEEAGRIDLDKVMINTNIPYFSDANAIAVYYRDEKIAEVKLEDFICNKNNICDFGESSINCPSDCGNKKSIYLLSIFIILTLTILIYMLLRKLLS